MSILLKNISKVFGQNVVLDDLDLEITKNGIYSMVGRSGAGKSTLINILSGLDTPTTGRIMLDNNPEEATKVQLQRNVAVIYQEYYLMNGMSVYDNIEIAMQLSGIDTDRDSIIKVLEDLNLSDLSDRKVEKLSGGERQRVAIARAYLSDSKIIVADEPTGNLDDENGIIVFELLQKVAREKIVIVVSHDRVFVDKYSDEIYEIEQGKFVNKRKFNSDANVDDESKKELVSISDNVSKLTKKSFFKLVKHLANKKKVLTIFICVLSIMIMSLIGAITAMSTSTFGSAVMGNINKDSSNIAFVSTNINTTLDNATVDTSILDENNIKYSKGLMIQDEGDRVDLDYSKENESMRYYLNSGAFNSLIEVSTDIGIKLNVGSMPMSSRDVIVPQYFVDQLVFTKTLFDENTISENKDIIGCNLLLGSIDYVITGVYASNNYYADLLAQYNIKDLINIIKSVEIADIQDNSIMSASLTALYFGEGFLDEFLLDNKEYLADILYLPSGNGIEQNFDNMFTIAAVNIDSLSTSTVNDIYNNSSTDFVSDNSGFLNEYFQDFEDFELILLIALGVLFLFNLALNVLMINLQYRDMKKDMGIMMSYGGNIRTMIGVFAVLYTLIYLAEIIISILLSLALMPVVNLVFGLALINVFVLNYFVVIALLGVSLITVITSLLLISLILHKTNLIVALRG